MRLVRSTKGFRRTNRTCFSVPPTPAALLSTPRLPALDPNPSPGNCDRLLDEAALIDRIKRGEEAAAEALVELMRPVILKCVRRRLSRWSSEEDLVQSVFAKVFAKLHQFSGSVPLEHWVARVAVNTSLSHIAHEAVRPEMRMSDLSEEQELVLQNQAEPQDDSAEKNYARELMDLLLARLEPDERLIITLLHIEQRSTQEISRLTGLSISLVKVRAFRTRHKMRRLARKLL
jgi:RNA polymerase sigma-70 factor (ECF subfamily)